MPFIPHTSDDVALMQEEIKINSISELFDEIPAALRIQDLPDIPEGLNEMALSRVMQERAAQDSYCLNFIGAGAYEHHIPAAVWDIAARGEWMTAYTPYQAEASQGTLQLLYEYQTMMADLMGMEVSNASLYDGASALAEAILMAVRIHPTSQSARILLPTSVHPNYREVVKTIVQAQNIEVVEIPFCPKTGIVLLESLKQYEGTDITALVVPSPNFFGRLEEVDALTDWGRKTGACVIGVVNPLSMALLKPPGQWGTLVGEDLGVDMVCGEGQPMGVPLASGGPYFGFLCCKKSHIRQLPGRLIGRTLDQNGKEGFTLTLQAREQHIRRGKATSNICTNQGLLVTAATVYMSLLGAEGLMRVAASSHANTRILYDHLISIPGVEAIFEGPFFHEIALRLPIPVDKVIAKLAEKSIQAGYNLKSNYPELGEALLVCATETKTKEDLAAFSIALRSIITSEVTVC
jgi:glycine dehydrogenase subunit 1